MSKEEIIAIKPDDVGHELLKEEMFHILRKLGGYLEFDYGTLENRNPERHFELRSGVHSDLFLDFSAVFQYENLRKIIAKQLVDKYRNSNRSKYNLDWINPTCVAGIPNGAKLLGKDVADILEARKIDFVKQDGNIKMKSMLGLHDTLLFVEDICTKGTALKKAVNVARKNNNSGRVLPLVLTIVNRGRLNQVRIDGGFVFQIISLYSIKFNEWDRDDCELCRMSSESIKSNEIKRVNLAT